MYNKEKISYLTVDEINFINFCYFLILGGPYAAFAGRDATRCLATFSVEVSNEGYDDLSDLNSMQMESVREWEIQFQG